MQEVNKKKFDKYNKDWEFNEGDLVFLKLQFGRYKALEDGGSMEKLAR